jgi:hypothetical protein
MKWLSETDIPKTVVDELLKLGRIPDRPRQRKSLVDDLVLSHAIYHYRRGLPQPKRQAYTNIIKAATHLKASMNVLSRQYGIRICYGIGMDDEDPIESHKVAHAGIDRIIAAVEKAARTIKLGQPKKERKLSVVSLAIEHLKQHARPQLKTRHLSDTQREFIERFYETATGETDACGKLEHQIRIAPDRLPRV